MHYIGFTALESFGLGTIVDGFGHKAYWAIATPVNTTAVPTPALLPGLVGMGLAAYRKHKLASSTDA